MARQQSSKPLAQLFREATEADRQGHYPQAQSGYQKILQQAPDNFDVLHLLGQSLIKSGQFGVAIGWLNRAVRINADSAEAHYDLGLACRKSGQYAIAAQAYRRALDIQPDFLKAHLSLVEMKLPGPHYTLLLKELHAWLKPETYLEIGVETGQSMALALADTHCIGVDPEPRISHTLPPRCDIYAQTSDTFFAQYNPRELFGQHPIEFAFIDGMHVFEAALRDFIAIERAAHRDTVIAIHDCLPLDAVTSARERTTNFWSGDVWKLVVCLKKYRPDLHLVTVAAKPTGLGLVTALDPQSRILETHYSRIVEEFLPLSYDAFVSQEHQALNVIANDTRTVTDWLQAQRLRQTG